MQAVSRVWRWHCWSLFVCSPLLRAMLHGPVYVYYCFCLDFCRTVNEENISLSLHANCHTSLPCDDIKQFGSELLFNNILLEVSRGAAGVALDGFPM